MRARHFPVIYFLYTQILTCSCTLTRTETNISTYAHTRRETHTHKNRETPTEFTDKNLQLIEDAADVKIGRNIS